MGHGDRNRGEDHRRHPGDPRGRPEAFGAGDETRHGSSRDDVRADRSPGSHADYYRGGDRGQERTGPEGGFESRSDYRSSEVHSDQGQSWSRSPSPDQPGRNELRRRSGSDHDPHYQQWRRRQIESLDRDYDEYRRENASRFESEFGSWRERRGHQRRSLSLVTAKMEVVGSDGEHIGIVDKVRGDRIVLTRNDLDADGHHHSIPCGWIDRVEDKVIINKSQAEATSAWRDEATSRASFEREDSGSSGPHILERSFSGTYRDES